MKTLENILFKSFMLSVVIATISGVVAIITQYDLAVFIALLFIGLAMFFIAMIVLWIVVSVRISERRYRKQLNGNHQ